MGSYDKFISHSVFINGEINIEKSGEIIRKIVSLSFSEEDIYILINSEGGKITAYRNILKAIESVKNKIITINIGIVASSAAMIFLSGNERIMFESSELIFHEPRIVLKGEKTYSEIRDIYLNMDNAYYEIIERVTKVADITREEFIMKTKNIDFKLSASKSLQYGFATKAIKSLTEIL